MAGEPCRLIASAVANSPTASRPSLLDLMKKRIASRVRPGVPRNPALIAAPADGIDYVVLREPCRLAATHRDPACYPPLGRVSPDGQRQFLFGDLSDIRPAGPATRLSRRHETGISGFAGTAIWPVGDECRRCVFPEGTPRSGRTQQQMAYSIDSGAAHLDAASLRRALRRPRILEGAVEIQAARLARSRVGF